LKLNSALTAHLYLSEKAGMWKQKQQNSLPLKLTVTYIGKKIHWIYYSETKFIMVQCWGLGTAMSLVKIGILELVFLNYFLPSCYMKQFSGKIQQTARKYFFVQKKIIRIMVDIKRKVSCREFCKKFKVPNICMCLSMHFRGWVHCWLLSLEAHVQSQGQPREICSWHSGTRAVFLQGISVIILPFHHYSSVKRSVEWSLHDKLDGCGLS
jgi:hypothetical protein